jgi:hypothetical protein
MNAYPRIPDPPERQPDEPRITYAHRVFAALVTAPRVPVFMLDQEQAEAALHASQMYITAPDTAPAALETYHAIRLQLHAAITKARAHALAHAPTPAQATQPPQPPSRNNGTAVLRPTPPTRPTPPAGAQQPYPRTSDRARMMETF